jgi:hypothetical protein
MNFKRLVTNWMTCACGNQCQSLPRLYSGAPEDHYLATLGVRFQNHVLHISDLAYDMFCGIDEQVMIEAGHNYQERILMAERTLRSIEERAAFLLAKQKKSL